MRPETVVRVADTYYSDYSITPVFLERSAFQATLLGDDISSRIANRVSSMGVDPRFVRLFERPYADHRDIMFRIGCGLEAEYRAYRYQPEEDDHLGKALNFTSEELQAEIDRITRPMEPQGFALDDVEFDEDQRAYILRGDSLSREVFDYYQQHGGNGPIVDVRFVEQGDLHLILSMTHAQGQDLAVGFVYRTEQTSESLLHEAIALRMRKFTSPQILGVRINGVPLEVPEQYYDSWCLEYGVITPSASRDIGDRLEQFNRDEHLFWNNDGQVTYDISYLGVRRQVRLQMEGEERDLTRKFRAKWYAAHHGFVVNRIDFSNWLHWAN